MDGMDLMDQYGRKSRWLGRKELRDKKCASA